MKSCTECRQENRDDARFCHQCGGAFPVETPTQEPVQAPVSHTDAELWKAFIGPNAERYLETQIAPQLDRAGLAWSVGRMVFEVRPPVAVDKGTAVKRLRGRRRIDHLLYAGDDRTDLDAFREATIRIAVRSSEGPAELFEAADACVDGPSDVVPLRMAALQQGP